MPANNIQIEKRLWSAAGQLRANSKMRSADYSIPVLSLIFLHYANVKFTQAEEELLFLKGKHLAGGRLCLKSTIRPAV